jgi:hypothetical protein
MANTAVMFTQFVNLVGTKQIALGTDTIRVIATTTTAPLTNYVAIQDTCNNMSSGANGLKAATGYGEVANAAGGSNYAQNANSTSSGLSRGAGTWTRSGHVMTLTSGTAIQWTTAGAGFAPTSLVFFLSYGTDATNLPICFIDLGGSQPGTGGNWTYTLTANGICQGTAS